MERWARLGVEGWGWEDEVLPALRKLETDSLRISDPARGEAGASSEGQGSHVHGQDGPIPIHRAPVSEWCRVATAMRAAALELGYPEHPDLNNPTATGISAFPFNVAAGADGRPRRQAVNEGYIEPARFAAPNLRIRCDVTVDRVLFTGRHAVGVSVVDSGGGLEDILAKREVLLCCGALHSPAVLQRSGVGPAALLKSHEIPVVMELSGVGRHLQDHPVINGCTPLTVAQDPTARHATTLVRFSSEPEDPRRFNDLYFVSVEQGNDPRKRSDGQAERPDEAPAQSSGCGYIDVMLLVVASEGYVEITSRDPAACPQASENMLSNPDDMARMVTGVRALAELLQTGPVTELCAPADPFLGKPGTELTPAAALEALVADAHGLDSWIASNASDGIHIAGSCKMGPMDDHTAVVDNHCTVRGLTGLRVCDASIMPTLVRANTHLSCIAIGEVMARRLQRPTAIYKFDLLADTEWSTCELIAEWFWREWPSETRAELGSRTADAADGHGTKGAAAEVARKLWDHNRGRDTTPITIVARHMHTGEPVGTVSIEPADLAGRDEEFGPWLAGCYVDVAHRRGGVGRLLLESCRALARRLGLARLHLWYPKSKTHLGTLYESCGWKVVEETSYTHSSFGDKIVIMRLEIVPTSSKQG